MKTILKIFGKGYRSNAGVQLRNSSQMCEVENTGVIVPLYFFCLFSFTLIILLSL